MKIENKLIVRRLIAGILLLLSSIIELAESVRVAEYGEKFDTSNFTSQYTSQAGIGLIAGAIAFIIALVFIVTCKMRPRKWVEISLAIAIAISFLFATIVPTNYFTDLPIFKWANLFFICLGLPWSKKGFKGMPYVSKAEKTMVEENNATEESDTIHREKAVSNEPRINVPDEIAKYKKLLDDGTITQDEFEAKKKQLLNL